MTDLQSILVKVGHRLGSGSPIRPPEIEFDAWAGLFEQQLSESDEEACLTLLDEAYGINLLNLTHTSAVHIQQEARIVELIAWSAQMLANWTAAADPNGRQLKAALATAILLRIPVSQLLSPSGRVIPSGQLLEVLFEWLSTVKIDFVTSGVRRLDEAEFVERFQRADAEGDWSQLAGDAPQVLDWVNSPWIGAVGRLLADFAPDRLVKATRQINLVLTAHAILQDLSDEQALDLGFESESDHIRFALLLSRAGKTRSFVMPLLKSDDAHLAKIWLRQASDLTTWPKWMSAFNTYPVRFPSLQKSIGLALVDMSHEAMEVYVQSVSLDSGPEGRKVMAECLTAFRATAPLERRKALWALAFARWTDWNFGDEMSGVLLGIKTSALDYAVIGHVNEGMTAEECANELGLLATQAYKIEQVWHRDVSQCKIALNRLLSRFHFIATGDSLRGTEQEWLGNKILLPKTLVDDKFFAARHFSDDWRLV